MRRSRTRHERLRGKSAIAGLFSGGRKLACAGARLVVRPNDAGYNRILVTLVRGFGTAVQRNRARRLGKEAYRLSKARLSPGHDLVFVLLPSQSGLLNRQQQLEALARRAGLLS